MGGDPFLKVKAWPLWAMVGSMKGAQASFTFSHAHSTVLACK